MLLSSMPHECTIRRKTRTKDALGGKKDGFIVEQTGVMCWEQQASASETEEYAKRGMNLQVKVFFSSDPAVSNKHQILITKRGGTAVSSPVPVGVLSEPYPDASAGLGRVFRVMCGRLTSAED